MICFNPHPHVEGDIPTDKGGADTYVSIHTLT